jgi:hypothetical protein
MRLEGKATMDTQGREKAVAWASCRSQPARSSSIRSSRDPDRRSSRSAPADDVDGERHFAVIVVSVIRIGWLDTSRSLHLHAVFQRDGRDWRGGWVST